jgi:lipopolysaccharide transport system permease protein
MRPRHFAFELVLSVTPTYNSSNSQKMLDLFNPVLIWRNVWRNRELIEQFTRRDVEGRYKASALGLMWTFINPLIMLGIYTFVFGVIFKAKWAQANSDSLAEFAVVLFCGLTTYNIFSEVVARAPGVIVGVPNYVKKVVFPLEILVVTALGAALFHASIAFCIVVLANLLVNGVVYWTIILAPLVLIPLCLLALGFGWFLASLGVFLRDISNIVTLAVQMLLFLTPIFYDGSTLPAVLRSLMAVNPMAWSVMNMRNVALWGTIPDFGQWLLWTAVSLGIALLGYAWFMKTRKAFADVL